MRILLCNDDGINASGIVALASSLLRLGNVTVVAPDGERSAASNSLTLSHPLRVKEVPFPVKVDRALAISGTPADCVKIAIANLMEERPDVVVSGINRGPNMCVDIFYSGTVAAAFEGAFKGILSLSVSLDSYNSDADYSVAAEWAAKCLERLYEAAVPAANVYNINVPALPADEIKGLKFTRAGRIDYREIYDHRRDPNGRSYYWIQGNPEIIDKSPECDVVAVKDGYVSLTPLQPELTNFACLKILSEKKLAI
ncbi:MAG: 5'/3'-nucleotidase SurE [Erysipelotrichia bacterium]|nr:5'/3'-nucleotidase SurE [Candidatus Riflebacteria bacterium]NCB38389.1 5'/3'-nucleotidase SurE [Erysipelotrichia bacterium]